MPKIAERSIWFAFCAALRRLPARSDGAAGIALAKVVLVTVLSGVAALFTIAALRRLRANKTAS